MTYRMLAASLVMLSGIGSAIAAGGAGTAPGALVGASSHGGFRPSAPAFTHPFTHMTRPMGPHRFFELGRRGDFFRRREHREGEFARWGWGDFPGYVPYDYPVEYPASYDEPFYRYAYPDIPATAPNVFRPPLHCSTESQRVPSESGGVQTINVTRCY